MKKLIALLVMIASISYATDKATFDQVYGAGSAGLTDLVSKADWKASLDPIGFVDESQWTLSFTNATRTFYLAPQAGGADYYFQGTKITKTTNCVVTISTNLGTHFIYFNDATGTLKEGLVGWGFSNYVQVATVFWGEQRNPAVGAAATTTNGLIGVECHGINFPWSAHELIHTTLGPRYASGLAGTFSTTGFSISAGIVYDEDLKDSMPVTNNCRIYYHITNQTAVVYTPVTNACILTNGANLAIYDANGAGTNTVPVNNYFAMWIYTGNLDAERVMAVMGQRVDSNIGNARANNTVEGLVLGDLPTQELKLLYRLIFHRGAGAGVIVYDEALDYRNVSIVPTTTYTPTSHGSLSGLATDQSHLLYDLLDGTRPRTGTIDLNSNNITNGNLIVAGSITTTNAGFTGNGSGLTNLNFVTSPTFIVNPLRGDTWTNADFLFDGANHTKPLPSWIPTGTAYIVVSLFASAGSVSKYALLYDKNTNNSIGVITQKEGVTCPAQGQLLPTLGATTIVYYVDLNSTSNLQVKINGYGY